MLKDTPDGFLSVFLSGIDEFCSYFDRLFLEDFLIFCRLFS